MNYELLRIAVALAGTAAAAWQDHKTSFIDDRIVYAMIGAGILFNLATLDPAFLLPVAAVAAVIGVVGFVSYKAGQFGGGDVFLFLGLHLLLPFYPSSLASSHASFLPGFPFVLSVFIAASFMASLGSTAWYAKRLVEVKAKLGNKPAYLAATAVLVAIALYFIGLKPALSVFFFLVWLSLAFFLLFKNEINDLVVVHKLKISEIEDEDVLAIDKLPKKIVEEYKLEKVLTAGALEKLKLVQKKEKISLFPVCKELPRFGPYVLLALAVCLIVGDLVVFLLLS